MSNIFLHPACSRMRKPAAHAARVRARHRQDGEELGLSKAPAPGDPAMTRGSRMSSMGAGQSRRPVVAWGAWEKRPGAASGLATNAEALDEGLVARFVLLLDVIEQGAALRDHFQQTATGVVVLHVGLEVVGQVGDPLGENRDLDLGRPRVADLQGILVDERALALGSNRHRTV